MAKLKVIFEGRNGIHSIILAVCIHTGIWFTVLYIEGKIWVYVQIFSMMDIFAFPGAWGKWEEVLFSICGIYHWKHNPTVPGGM